MRRLLAFIVLAVAFAAIAPVPGPSAARAEWSGFYAGGHAGWSRINQSASSSPQPAGFGQPAILGAMLAGSGFFGTGHGLDTDSFSGGIHAGWNWQGGPWVVGIEGDVSGFAEADRTSAQSFVDTCCGSALSPAPVMTLNASADWLASLRLRAGYATQGWLVYATGGPALAGVSYRADLTPDGLAFPAGSGARLSLNDTALGFAVGGGVERAFQAWRLRLEYIYHRFPGSDGSAPVTGAVCAGCRFEIDYSELELHTLRFGISHKF